MPHSHRAALAADGFHLLPAVFAADEAAGIASELEAAFAAVPEATGAIRREDGLLTAGRFPGTKTFPSRSMGTP